VPTIPRLVVSQEREAVMRDNQSRFNQNALAVLGEYERAVREGRFNLADAIAIANPDLREHFERVQAKLLKEGVNG